MNLNRLLIAVATAAFISQGATMLACEIPVFRYALERWAPDAYQVLVVHRQPLTSEQQKLVDQLEKSATDLAKPANVMLVNVDLTATSEDPLVKSLQESHKSAEPLMLLRQPHPMPDTPPIWKGALTAENVKRLIDSPARQELVKRLTSGESAVWVMLDSGDAQKDDAAAATLTRELARLANELKLPDKQTLEADEFFKPETKVTLKIDFSVLRLKPGDAEEEFLREMLLASEAGLKEKKEPIALPVFGRGRGCFALVGKGIIGQTIEENCKFLTGRCSCQVKQENPGVDLLVAANWDNLVGGPAHPGGPVPELSGLGVLVVDVEPAGRQPEGVKQAILGQKPITPVAATPESTAATVQPTSVAKVADTPAETKDPPAPASEKVAPAAAPSAPHAGPNFAETDATGPLMLWVGVVIVVGLLVAVGGSMWLKRRGGAGL